MTFGVSTRKAVHLPPASRYSITAAASARTARVSLSSGMCTRPRADAVEQLTNPTDRRRRLLDEHLPAGLPSVERFGHRGAQPFVAGAEKLSSSIPRAFSDQVAL